MTKYEQMSNLMITRPRSELAKFAKRYRISMAKEAAMIVLPIIAPGKEDTFLSKIGSSSANESEITYKVTQQLIEVYYATADPKKPAADFVIICEQLYKGKASYVCTTTDTTQNRFS